MRRREILSVGPSMMGLGAVGCIGDADDENLQAADIDPETFERTVDILEYDDTPSDFPAEFSIEVTQRRINASQTARLQVTATSTAEDRWVRAQIPYYKTDVDDHPILVHATNAGDSPPNNYVPMCISGELTWEYEGFTGETAPFQDLAPGSSWTSTLLVAENPERDTCFPTGIYHYEMDHTLADAGFSWGFVLGVE